MVILTTICIISQYFLMKFDVTLGSTGATHPLNLRLDGHDNQSAISSWKFIESSQIKKKLFILFVPYIFWWKLIMIFYSFQENFLTYHNINRFYWSLPWLIVRILCFWNEIYVKIFQNIFNEFPFDQTPSTVIKMVNSD